MFIHLNLDPIERPRHGKTNVRGSGQDAAKAFGVFFQAFWCPFLPVPYLHKFMWPVLGSFFGQKFKDYGGQKLEIIVLNHFDVICLPPLVIVNLIFGLSATPLRAKGFALVRSSVRSCVRHAISRKPRIRF